jgi:hypothetical protein
LFLVEAILFFKKQKNAVKYSLKTQFGGKKFCDKSKAQLKKKP